MFFSLEQLDCGAIHKALKWDKIKDSVKSFALLIALKKKQRPARKVKLDHRTMLVFPSRYLPVFEA